MERWHIGVNGYFGFASLYRERGPWWAFALEGIATWLMVHTPHWRVPFVGRIRIMRPCGADDAALEPTTVAEWYGDRLCEWACCWFNDYQDLWRRHYVTVSIRVSLEQLMAAWGAEAPAYWREEWERGGEAWRENGRPNDDYGPVMRTVELPPAADAVDPHAASTGKLTTRD